jgi:hypothetical protein
MALVAVTDTSGVVHLVTDEAMAAGRAAGRYWAICGYPVLSASLTAPERQRCSLCLRRAARR